MKETDPRSRLEFLIFELGGRRYGLPVADVREIVRAVPLVPLPGAPAVIEGVINLHGRVIPVLDLRRRYRLPAKPLELTDHFVIARVADLLVALRVDRAMDFVQLVASDVEDIPGVSSSERRTRIARLPNDLVLIQDLRTLLSESESARIEDALPALGAHDEEGEQA